MVVKSGTQSGGWGWHHTGCILLACTRISNQDLRVNKFGVVWYYCDSMCDGSPGPESGCKRHPNLPWNDTYSGQKEPHAAIIVPFQPTLKPYNAICERATGHFNFWETLIL